MGEIDVEKEKLIRDIEKYQHKTETAWRTTEHILFPTLISTAIIFTIGYIIMFMFNNLFGQVLLMTSVALFVGMGSASVIAHDEIMEGDEDD